MPTLPGPLISTPTVPFARTLAASGDRVAVITPDGELTYRELAARVADVARELGDTRRLVLVAGANELDPLVAYLAALAAGHPVLLVPRDNPSAYSAMLSAYDPDVVVAPVDGRWRLEERRLGSAHDLHRDLALLLSTSGSTGSPKLVRLSHENVQANAEAIAGSLQIQGTDRAATTLPMHYCYGLSVLNSHLLRGAGLILTDLSVVDACFWDRFREHRGTTFAGVPYTFDLLERVGFPEMALPDLRYVTQAGGRLAPERVRRYAALGQRQGWDLFVMYGQTEATSRMAYLPPDLAAEHPTAIGIPVPGGSFTLEPLRESGDPGARGETDLDVGELVYAGPNVMLGYAETPADLGLGRTIDVLRTGDLARRRPDGLYEVVGRRSRFVKIVGLRIDLQRVETVLEQHGIRAVCVGGDGELVVVVEHNNDTTAVRRLAARELGLPASAVRVCAVPALPRLPSGKPDYRALEGLSRAVTEPDPVSVPAQRTASLPDTTALRALFAELLDRRDVTDDSTFVSLGGDSLSYVEMSVRLEEALGHLPASWHSMPIRDLVPDGAIAGPAPRRRRARTIEIGVAVRAVGIILIVATHVHLFTLQGSAHVLLAIAGFNVARFNLSSGTRRERLRSQLASVARIAVPSVVWILGAYLLTDTYSLANVFLLNGLLGPPTWTTTWRFWFIEVLVYIVVALTALLAVPSVDRLERRHPFGFPLALLGLGLLGRYGVLDLDLLDTKPALWLFALGWATARATTTRQRAFLTAVTLAAVPGFFGDPRRDAVILAGVALLLWVPRVRCPAALTRLAGVLASSSLYIYLTHWQVYPHLAQDHPVLAVVVSVAVGIAYWLLMKPVVSRLVTAVPTLRDRRTAGGSRSSARSSSSSTSSRMVTAARRPSTTSRAAAMMIARSKPAPKAARSR